MRAFGLLFCLFAFAQLNAQEPYPVKPVKIVVPYAPGG